MQAEILSFPYLFAWRWYICYVSDKLLFGWQKNWPVKGHLWRTIPLNRTIVIKENIYDWQGEGDHLSRLSRDNCGGPVFRHDTDLEC